MADEERETLQLIRRLLQTESTSVEPGKFAGLFEMRIAGLYLKIGCRAEAGHWFVLAARKAERYTQDPLWILEIAAEKLPDHLEVREELKTMKRQYLGE